MTKQTTIAIAENVMLIAMSLVLFPVIWLIMGALHTWGWVTGERK